VGAVDAEILPAPVKNRAQGPPRLCAPDERGTEEQVRQQSFIVTMPLYLCAIALGGILLHLWLTPTQAQAQSKRTVEYEIVTGHSSDDVVRQLNSRASEGYRAKAMALTANKQAVVLMER
jgi:hypothetical protein